MIFIELEPGETVEGNPIKAYHTDVKAEKYLYLLAGTHGDEVEGVFVLKELFEWLKHEHGLKDIPIVVVPILNVDGYRSSSRVNSHAVDLNRNYPSDNWCDKARKDKYHPGPKPLSEPENQFLVKLFDKFKPGLVLSFHSWKPLLNYNGDIKDVADYLASHNEYETVADIGYPTPGSLGCFVPEKYQAGVLTFECPVLSEGYSLKEIWQKNEEGLKSFLQSSLLLEKLK
jgi:protein MpaA